MLLPRTTVRIPLAPFSLTLLLTSTRWCIGSLLARIVFQPLEETLRLYFSKLLSAPTPSTLSTASASLTSLLQTQLSFSLFFVIFGSSYLPFVLPLVLPPEYLATSAGSVLEAWVYLIPWLSLNGSLEAFLSSAAGAGEVRRQSKSVLLSPFLYFRFLER